jgi:hypothetical protein
MSKKTTLRGCVEDFAKARLGDRGFGYAYESRLPTFRRTAEVDAATVAVQLVEFQAGVKSDSFGFFTVTLGVYSPELTYPPRGVDAEQAHSWHCMTEMWTRLGALLPLEARSARNWSQQRLTEGMKDRWWPYKVERSEVERIFETVTDFLERYGVPWLEAASTREAFALARSGFEARASRTVSP